MKTELILEEVKELYRKWCDQKSTPGYRVGRHSVDFFQFCEEAGLTFTLDTTLHIVKETPGPRTCDKQKGEDTLEGWVKVDRECNNIPISKGQAIYEVKVGDYIYPIVFTSAAVHFAASTRPNVSFRIKKTESDNNEIDFI